MNFKGKTAIATGAASGMALLFLQKMAAAGANVVLTDVNQDAVEAAAEEIRSRGGNAIGVAVDVRNYSQIEHAVNLATEKFGGVDFLMNSAGGAASRIWSQPHFGTASIESIEWCIDVNLKGAVLFSRAVLKQMCERRSGVIINMSSVSSKFALPGQSVYSATKGAVNSMTQTMAKELAGYGIRVNAVAPGFIETEMLDAIPEEKKKEYLDAIPMHKLGKAEDVANVVSSLCSDAFSYVTGQVIVLDGGLSL